MPEFGGELLRQGQQGSQAKDRYLIAIADNFRFADRQRHRMRLDRGARSRAAGITHRGGPRLQQGCVHHVRQLILIFRDHVDDVGNTAQIADVKKTVMRRSIIAG